MERAEAERIAAQHLEKVSAAGCPCDIRAEATMEMAEGWVFFGGARDGQPLLGNAPFLVPRDGAAIRAFSTGWLMAPFRGLERPAVLCAAAEPFPGRALIDAVRRHGGASLEDLVKARGLVHGALLLGSGDEIERLRVLLVREDFAVFKKDL